MPLFARFFFILLFTSLPLVSNAAAPSVLDRLRERTLTVQVQPLELGAIPRGAQRVSFLSLEFTASCDGDVRLRELEVHHLGLGESDDIKGVYLLKGMERITKSAPVSSSSSGQTVTLRMKGVRVSACEKMTLTVAADFTADADIGSEHRFEILSAEDIVTDTDKLIAPKFPLRNPGRMSVTPLPAGGITVTFLPLSGSLSPGADRTLAKFQLAADNESHHLLYGILLTNDGSAKDDDLRSLYLTRKSGKALTQLALALKGKEVLLSFSKPYLLKRGDKAVFELRGRTFTTQETINFVLKEPGDLNALPLRGGRRVGE